MGRILLLALIFVMYCQLAAAWSAKEHIMITRVAVRDLLADPGTPEGMKKWLSDAQPALGDAAFERDFLLHTHIGIYPRGVDGIAFWAVMPDLMADSAAGRKDKVAPFGVTEGLLHYIDLEYFMPEESRRVYAPDMSNKPRLADIPHDLKDLRYQKAGMLPFRIEESHARLVSTIQSGRLCDEPNQFPHDEHATKWAGYLAHYAADNWMPYHATADYQGYSYFPEFERKPRVHFDFEFRLTDADDADYPELRSRFWDAFVDYVNKTKPACG